MTKKTRARYSPTEKMEKLFKEMPLDKLELKGPVMQALNKQGIKVTPQHWGRVRARVLKERKGLATDTPDLDLLKNIQQVGALAKRLGGLEQLKQTISIIEKVKDI